MCLFCLFVFFLFCFWFFISFGYCSYGGAYLFTIELDTLNKNDWLMLYGFSSGIYGMLMYVEDDTNGDTFVFLDTQAQSSSCWARTLTAIDGTTFLFDISKDGKSVNGVELIDNTYGEVFSNGNGNGNGNWNKDNYLKKRAKHSHSHSHSQKYDDKKQGKQQDTLINMLRKHHPLQSPMREGKAKRSGSGNQRFTVGRNPIPKALHFD